MGLEVSVWIDEADEAVPFERTSRPIASALLVDSAEHAGLAGLPTPLECRLPSGLALSVSCERVPTGLIHVGISHDGDLVHIGSYRGPLAMRFFPAGHDTYLVNVDQPGRLAIG